MRGLAEGSSRRRQSTIGKVFPLPVLVAIRQSLHWKSEWTTENCISWGTIVDIVTAQQIMAEIADSPIFIWETFEVLKWQTILRNHSGYQTQDIFWRTTAKVVKLSVKRQHIFKTWRMTSVVHDIWEAITCQLVPNGSSTKIHLPIWGLLLFTELQWCVKAPLLIIAHDTSLQYPVFQSLYQGFPHIRTGHESSLPGPFRDNFVGGPIFFFSACGWPTYPTPGWTLKS